MSRREDQLLLRTNGTATIVPNGPSETEKVPFLTEPVRLTPAWEESNLPNDELNFKGMTMERAKMQISPPRDRLNLIYFTLLIHGIGTLMPWNMFITAKSYFVDHKLSASYTGEQSLYAANFMPYVSLAAQIPNVFFNWVNIFVDMGGNLTTRIVISILVEVMVFVVTVALAMSNSSEWPGVFFWITMVTVIILNMAGGIYQNTVYGMAAKLPFKYTGAVVLGSNISGTFTSVINILSSSFSSSPRTAAIYYFITAMFVLLLCFDTYFALPLNKYFRYHEMLNDKETEKNRIMMNQHGRTVPLYWTVFKQAWPQLFNVFFVFFITLAIFPAVHSDIKISNPATFMIGEDQFVSIVCFLTFNLSAMLGSLTTSWIQWPSPKYLVWPVLLRAALLPLFLVCNYQPLDVARIMPIYITNDYIYWAIAIVMGYTSGYFSSLGMMYTPHTVAPQFAMTAGMFAAAMLITGIFAGILFSWAMPFIVTNVTW